jgi:hypothetical protein
MALNSPPSLPLSRLWAESSVRRFLSYKIPVILFGHTSQDPCRLSILILFPPLKSLPDPKFFFSPLVPEFARLLVLTIHLASLKLEFARP